MPAPDRNRVCIVCTMPKSGTWYVNYFFHFLSYLLRKQTTAPAVIPNHNKLRSIPELGIHSFGVFHAEYPGFAAHDGRLRLGWNQLQYHCPGYNWAGPLFQAVPALLPSHNPDVRYVYLVRNPLDQAVSYFFHGLNHKDSTVLARKNPQGVLVRTSTGSPWTPSDPREFYMHNFESYLKQYLTWRIPLHSGDPHILLLPYAHLIRSPEAIFRRILSFFGANTDSPGFHESYTAAIQLSSKKNISAIESQIGRSLGNDQKTATSRHVRDGSVGKWRRYFQPEDLERTLEILAAWNIPATDFVFD